MSALTNYFVIFRRFVLYLIYLNKASTKQAVRVAYQTFTLAFCLSLLVNMLISTSDYDFSDSCGRMFFH